jgi:hypothetical protein
MFIGTIYGVIFHIVALNAIVRRIWPATLAAERNSQ